MVKSVFSRDNLTMAAGVAGGVVVTNWVMLKFGNSLPGFVDATGAGKLTAPVMDATSGTSQRQTVTTAGSLLYNIGIPIGLALLTRKISPQFSKGALIGGIFLGVSELLELSGISPANAALASTENLMASGTNLGAFVGNSGSPRALSAPIGGNPRGARAPAYNGVTAFSAPPSASRFPTGAALVPTSNAFRSRF